MDGQPAGVNDAPAVQPARVDTLFAIEYQLSRMLSYAGLATLAAMLGLPLHADVGLPLMALLLAGARVLRWTARERLANLVAQRNPSAVASAIYAEERPGRRVPSFHAQFAEMCEHRPEFPVAAGDPLVQRLVLRRIARLRPTIANWPAAEAVGGMLMDLLPERDRGLDCANLAPVARRTRLEYVYRRASKLLGPDYAPEIAAVLTGALSEETMVAVRALASASPEVRGRAERALASLPARELGKMTHVVGSVHSVSLPPLKLRDLPWIAVGLVVLLGVVLFCGDGFVLWAWEWLRLLRLTVKFRGGRWLAIVWPTFTVFLAEGSSLDQLPVLIRLLPYRLLSDLPDAPVQEGAARRGVVRLLHDVTGEYAPLIGVREREVLRWHVAYAAKAAARPDGATVVTAEIAEYLKAFVSALGAVGDRRALRPLEALRLSVQNSSTSPQLLEAVDRAIASLEGLRQTGTLLRPGSPVQDGNLLVPSAPSAAGAPEHLLHTVEAEEQGESKAVRT